jgi:hypothetical protein
LVYLINSNSGIGEIGLKFTRLRQLRFRGGSKIVHVRPQLYATFQIGDYGFNV